jgi:serine/threonine protein phosphatase 1
MLLSSLRRAAYTDDRALLFVHAGVDASRPLEAQGDVLWWGASGFGEWRTPYQGFRLVVRGFDPAHAGLVGSAYSLSIDGGSGFGGKLMAVCVDRTGEVAERIEA